MKKGRVGFTLIELLVVIAIIGILVSMITVGLSRAIEKAKIADVKNDMNSLRTALVTYYTDYSSFPPAYGFKNYIARDYDVGDLPRQKYFNLRPYTDYILDQYDAEDLYDRFADSHNVDMDGSLDMAEFSPVLVTDPTDGNADLIPEGYKETDASDFPYFHYLLDSEQVLDDTAANDMEHKGPYLYFPVNLRQFERAKDFWEDASDYMAETSLESLVSGGQLQFPPKNYDAYVLIGVGPSGTTAGLTDAPSGFFTSIDSEDAYHVMSLRAYYLATRDANGNGKPDYAFESRNGKGEDAVPSSYKYQNGNGDDLNYLPDGTNGAGPIIEEYKA